MMKVLVTILVSVYVGFLVGTSFQLMIDRKVHAKARADGVGFLLGAGEERTIINEEDEDYYIKMFVY